MPSVNPEIFRAYDIRGIYGADFDVNFAEEFGNKIAQALGGKSLVVGRDSRPSSEVLEKAVIEGALHAGVDVVAIDACTTPSLYFAVREKNAGGGIMITASHNPPQYNGFKVVDADTRVIGGQELMKIYSETALNRDGGGRLEQYDALTGYADAIVALTRTPGASHATVTFGVKGSKITEKILNRIGEKAGILVVPTNAGGIEVVFDDDSDRITFFDQRKPIDADLITLLLAEKLGYKKIVHDFRFARTVRTQFEKLGITAIPSRVGRLSMYENMKNYDAEFGAEISGHYYFRDFQYLEAPEAVLLYVRNIIQSEGKNLAELTRPYDTYYRSQEMKFPANPDMFSKIEERYSDGKITKDDGILVEYDDWWFSLRLSNTEPVMRLMVEADSKELLNRRVQELVGVLHV